jgi:antitoxin StbD
MTHQILTNMVASITDLKKHPMQTVNAAGGESLAILNRNEPVFYCVPTALYHVLMEALDDRHLAALVKERAHEKEIEVNLHDL